MECFAVMSAELSVGHGFVCSVQRYNIAVNAMKIVASLALNWF
jgi:hypothetical protein